ncbi:glutaredoxin [Coemansia javaensis]|uniref:Glutaredoxin n=1 Tax=Coemansia javaensis TaxID=2761396 RepID=A0A9W8HHA2_9FUNG|nr:glutaredoxin [Coemansia javaensis]
MAAANVIQLEDEAVLRAVLEKSDQEAVLFFWADWAEQCAQVDAVISDLALKYAKTQFFKIEAERFEDISEAYEISAVPTVVVAKKATIIGRVDGVNVPQLVQQIAATCGAANGISAAAAAGAAATAAASPADYKQDLNTRLKGLIERAPVMVFIKGTAAQPRCGFSKKIVGLLNERGIKYGYFDILTDDQVRQGLKEYSDWPTYPQLYIGGELVGGLDIVDELIASGELMGMIPKDSVATVAPAVPAPAAPAAAAPAA